MNETIFLLAVTALVSLPLCLALASAGLPLASAVLLANPPKRLKVFRDKFGQQTATLCLLAGMTAVLCMAGGAAFLKQSQPAAAAFWLSWPLPLAPLAIGVLVCGALAAAYRAVWQNMRDNRPLHAALGLAASLSGWGLGYLFVSFFRHFVVSPSEPGADPTLFLPPLQSGAWLILPCALALTLVFAGATAALYLIHRRDKDDFGRDYYNYTLKLACKWALFSTLPALAAAGGLFAQLWPLVRNLPVRPFFFWSQGGALAAFAMACLLWALVMKNQNPLRLKLHCVAAFVLAWLGLAGLGCAWIRFFLG